MSLLLLSLSSSLRRVSPSKVLSPISSFSTTSSKCSLSYKDRLPTPPQKTWFSNSESQEFMMVFPDLVRELTLENYHKDVPLINKHFSKCIQYNVPTGKKNRGLAVPLAYKLLRSSEPSEEELRLAHIMGWCVEFLQTFFLVSDDIMDGSETRRNQLCWYRRPDIGSSLAFNDAIAIETFVYALLEKHFSDKPYYARVITEFHKTTRHTIMGQSLDLLTSRRLPETGLCNLDEYDMKSYAAIVKYKTAYYSFFFPISLGMNMAGVQDTELYRQSRTILLEMGHFFQVQDDFLDCFGDPEVTGKQGTDIADGKCSWLIVVALQRANNEQKELLRSNYGSSDPEKIAIVKSIYEDLKLPKIFRAYEDESYEDIIGHIDQIPGGGELLPRKLFTTFLDRIYKRDM